MPNAGKVFCLNTRTIRRDLPQELFGKIWHKICKTSFLPPPGNELLFLNVSPKFCSTYRIAQRRGLNSDSSFVFPPSSLRHVVQRSIIGVQSPIYRKDNWHASKIRRRGLISLPREKRAFCAEVNYISAIILLAAGFKFAH